MAQVDLWVDGDDLDEAQKSGQFVFDVPSDAVSRGNLNDPLDDKAKANWIQTMGVVESKVYDDVTEKDGVKYPCKVIEVKMQVASDALRPKTGEADPNAGRTHTAWYRIVPEAFKNKMHPKYKANNFNLGKAQALLRSIWGTEAIPHGVKVNLSDFYSGVTPPVIGQTITANMKASRYNGDRKDEITDFIPKELQGS